MRGQIISERIFDDLRHALDFMEAHPDIDNNRIALFGHNLGGDGNRLSNRTARQSAYPRDGLCRARADLDRGLELFTKAGRGLGAIK